MTKEEMIYRIQENLNLSDGSRYTAISDVVTEALEYCNVPELPEGAEPLLRRKVKGILDYEEANGTGYVQGIASIKEGDGSITYASAPDKESVYGLNEADRQSLKRYRRLRGYAESV